jgi:hypothetical protein
MSPLRESLVLPCLFLTVVLLGGLRIGADVRLVPPPVEALVLAVLLIGALVRSRVLVPERLMRQGRTPLENACGFIVLATLFAASAQAFNLVTPDTGLLHLLVTVFFVVQILTTFAGVRDRIAMLRSLVVLFACAFVLRFVALESLYAPGRGLMKRVMTALLEGITLGALDYQPTGPITGYVAFLALTLFIAGLVLLGSPTDRAARHEIAVTGDGESSIVAGTVLIVALGVFSGCADGGAARAANSDLLVSAAQRDAALASARVWSKPSLPIAEIRFATDPDRPEWLDSSREVSCRFVIDHVRAGGTTPKFYCAVDGGETIKVKYGAGNAELFAEVIATRLLSALGFGADRMFVVERVRCYGCPPFPFQAIRCRERTGLLHACLAGARAHKPVTFEPAVIERRLDGRRIQAIDNQGWAWHELERIDASRGGSSRREVDALRLMAVILAHWDNKAENQRLVCAPGSDGPDGGCARPLAIMQDLGATFGPAKLDLPNWERTPVWVDTDACRVSMEQLPFEGATFPETTISEEGRQFLLGLLDQLTAQQLRELFAGAAIGRFDGISAESRDPRAWAHAFLFKIEQVRRAGPCPPAASLHGVSADPPAALR